MGLKARRFGSVSAFSPLRVTVSLSITVFSTLRAMFSLGKSAFAFASDVFVLYRRFILSEPRFHSVSPGNPVYAFDYDAFAQ